MTVPNFIWTDITIFISTTLLANYCYCAKWTIYRAHKIKVTSRKGSDHSEKVSKNSYVDQHLICGGHILNINKNTSRKASPLQDSRRVRSSHAFSLHMKCLSIWIVAVCVTLPAAAVQYGANDRVSRSARLVMSNKQRMSGGHTAGGWRCKTWTHQTTL